MRPDPTGLRQKPSQSGNGAAPDKSTLELAFITVIGVLVACAFVAALTYETASAVAPLCVMAPLLILIGLQFRSSLRACRVDRVASDLMEVIRGGNRVFNGIAIFIGWMTVLVGLIFLAGHYIGIAVFMFVLLRIVSRESMVLSAGVSATVTLLVYVLFEYAFRIEMYRGVLDRWL